MSWGEGWRRTFSAMCLSETVFCCHCGFSFDFLHEFLEFNNPGACRQFARYLTANSGNKEVHWDVEGGHGQVILPYLPAPWHLCGKGRQNGISFGCAKHLNG